jgi:hypothetical protein
MFRGGWPRAGIVLLLSHRRPTVADCSDSLLKVFRANPAYRDDIETASQSQTLKSEPIAHDRLAEHMEQWEMLRVETLRSDFPGLR